jgi:hypothetical protein
MWLLWRVPEWCSRTGYGSRVWCGNKNKNGYSVEHIFLSNWGKGGKIASINDNYD